MSKQKKQINSKTKTTMGILGIILGISLLVFNYVDKKIDYAYTYMNNKIFAYNETKAEEEKRKEEEEKKKQEEEKKKQEEVETVTEEGIDPTPYDSNYNYIGTLEVPKVGLKKGFLDMNSTDNNVDKNIAVMQGSDYPNVSKGNFIIAGHSGTAWNSFFNQLYQLVNGDVVYVYYQNVKYTYQIVNIYEQPKVGTVNVYRNKEKTTLTLITCTKDSSTTQTLYVAELRKKANY